MNWNSIDLLPEVSMTPGQFERFARNEPSKVRAVRFVPPTLGSDGFGCFLVKVRPFGVNRHAPADK